MKNDEIVHIFKSFYYMGTVLYIGPLPFMLRLTLFFIQKYNKVRKGVNFKNFMIRNCTSILKNCALPNISELFS